MIIEIINAERYEATEEEVKELLYLSYNVDNTEEAEDYDKLCNYCAKFCEYNANVDFNDVYEMYFCNDEGERMQPIIIKE